MIEKDNEESKHNQKKSALDLFLQLVRTNDESSIFEIFYLSGKMRIEEHNGDFSSRLKDFLGLFCEEGKVNLTSYLEDAKKTIDQIIKYHFIRMHFEYAMGFRGDGNKLKFYIDCDNLSMAEEAKRSVLPYMDEILGSGINKNKPDDIKGWEECTKESDICFPCDKNGREDKINNIYVMKEDFIDNLTFIYKYKKGSLLDETRKHFESKLGYWNTWLELMVTAILDNKITQNNQIDIGKIIDWIKNKPQETQNIFLEGKKLELNNQNKKIKNIK